MDERDRKAMNKMKKTTIDSKDFENIDKDLLYLRLEKKN